MTNNAFRALVFTMNLFGYYILLPICTLLYCQVALQPSYVLPFSVSSIYQPAHPHAWNVMSHLTSDSHPELSVKCLTKSSPPKMNVSGYLFLAADPRNLNAMLRRWNVWDGKQRGRSTHIAFSFP